MKVTLGSKGGRVTRSLAKVTPVYASTEIEGLPLDVEPEAEEEAEVTPAERWERLVGEELGEEEPEPVVAAVIVPEPPSPLEQAFAMMGKLVEATANRPAPPAPVVHVHNNDPDQAFEAMERVVAAMAGRDAPTYNVLPAAAPNVLVHVPEQQPPSVNVNVPAQEAPRIEVNIPEHQPPDVHVSVEAPTVHVAAPEVSYEPPDVFVTVEPPRPGSVRMEIDEDGTRRFIHEEEGS